MFTHDAAEPTAGGSADLLPDGTYELRIMDVKEKTTKKDSYPMVNVTCLVINNPSFIGKKVFHNVTFMPKDKKGAGMSTHFLKCINQPWEGAIEVNPKNWIGEVFKARVASREYKNDKGIAVKINDIKEIEGTIPF